MPNFVIKRNVFEKVSQILSNRIAISLSIIIVISLLLRTYYFPYKVPLVLDAFSYFTYATDTSLLGHLPFGYPSSNNGWSMFLSFFFIIFHFNNFLDYMTLQRLLSVSISVLTTIPVYLLCTRFFDKRFALIGAILFAVEPHIIQNSLLGITEPLYIIGVTLTLFLFLSNNKKMVYISFGVAALSTIVRYEGAMMIIILTIMYFVRFRKEKRVIIKYIFALSIFVMILLPIAYTRIQTSGNDGLSSQIINNGVSGISEKKNNGSVIFIVHSIENYIKYTGWILIPFYIFLIPIGIYQIFRNVEHRKITVIISFLVLSIPALYAFGRDFQDPRYLYVLYPLFSILSIFTLQKIIKNEKNDRKKILVIFTVVLILSVIFLEVKKYDYQYQVEAFEIAKYVTSVTNVINSYYPEDNYIIVAQLPNEWPHIRSSINFHTHTIPTDGYDSISEYIESSKKEGLTNIIADNDVKRPSFLIDVYNHEEKYPYLEKIYDSSLHGYKYHVKIFKIDYDKFEMLNKKI